MKFVVTHGFCQIIGTYFDFPDNKTPAEACGITIQGDDKWKTLIQRASL
jgi:hypothetical protein